MYIKKIQNRIDSLANHINFESCYMNVAILNVVPLTYCRHAGMERVYHRAASVPYSQRESRSIGGLNPPHSVSFTLRCFSVFLLKQLSVMSLKIFLKTVLAEREQMLLQTSLYSFQN